MSRISNTKDAAQHSALALFRIGAHAQAAAAAITSAPIVVTYTTDNPSFTANAAQVIADGDAVTAAEALASLREVAAFQDALTVDIADARTALNALLASGAEQGDTAVITAETLFKTGIAFTYTTDNPAFTANNAVTVADGDASTSTTTRGENLQFALELNAENLLQLVDLRQIVKRINSLVGGGADVFSHGPCPALGSASNPITITFTTDNPSITPGATLTISDGDTPTGPELLEYCVELDDQCTKNRADLAVVRTALVAALKLCGIV